MVVVLVDTVLVVPMVAIEPLMRVVTITVRVIIRRALG